MSGRMRDDMIWLLQVRGGWVVGVVIVVRLGIRGTMLDAGAGTNCMCVREGGATFKVLVTCILTSIMKCMVQICYTQDKLRPTGRQLIQCCNLVNC